MDTILRLDNPIMDYAWGSSTAIPELLGREPDGVTPQAELWMGAHPKAPSEVVVEGIRQPLTALIEKSPEALLGSSVAERFGNRLPYLFKVLAADQPLSIQAHPNREQAAEGYRRETASEIALDAPDRNYRDPNHKPECICALTPFWAMVGFRPWESIRHHLDAVDAEAPGTMPPIPVEANDAGGPALRRFFAWLLNLEMEQKLHIIKCTVDYAAKRQDADTVCRWIVDIHRSYPTDIGVLSPFFLHLIRLEPGQALFLPAGELHAYLKGVGIELMANSDNVLRGGLTPKHIDAPELFRVLTFQEKTMTVLTPRWVDKCEGRYVTPAEEFALSVVAVQGGDVYRSAEKRSVEILLCTRGSAEMVLSNRNAPVTVGKGSCVLVPAAAPAYRIAGDATLYKAAVPL
jgi:mannose-6-phosphate isomerase